MGQKRNLWAHWRTKKGFLWKVAFEVDLPGGRDLMKIKGVKKRASWVEKPARVKVGEGADRLSKALNIPVEGAGSPLAGKGDPATWWRNLYVIRGREGEMTRLLSRVPYELHAGAKPPWKWTGHRVGRAEL